MHARQLATIVAASVAAAVAALGYFGRLTMPTFQSTPIVAAVAIDPHDVMVRVLRQVCRNTAPSEVTRVECDR